MHARDLLRQSANLILPQCAITAYLWPRQTHNATHLRPSEPPLAAASWTLGIWAVIFAGQLAYAIYQAMPQHHSDALLRRIGGLSALNAFGSLVWITAFAHGETMLEWCTSFALLGVLITLDVRLGDDAREGKELWLVRIPFALNFGWIAVTSVLDTASLVSLAGFDGGPLSPTTWAGLLMGIAALTGALMALVRGNVAFTAVVIWGLLGVSFYEKINAPEIANIAVLCTVGLLLVIVAEMTMNAMANPWRNHSSTP